MIKIKTPVLPESINEGKIIKWHKKIGDSVNVDDLLVEIETDKVILEVLAEESGVISEILIEEGKIIKEKQELGSIQIIANNENTNQKVAENNAINKKNIIREAQNINLEDDKEELKNDLEDIESKDDKEELKNDLEDIESKNTYIEENNINERLQESVPMTSIKKTIAKKLHAAKQNTAMVTTFNEADISKIIFIRNKYKLIFNKKYGVNLGFMSFFVKATVDALKKYPTVNAYIKQNNIVYNGYCDISIAVSSTHGLFVPVLRDAHKMSMHDIERKIQYFVEKAQNNSLTAADMNGGTFTISNGGVFGSLLSTPILNSPQSAILGMHKIQKRPVVIKEEIVIRSMMYLALSYDHRIIDGKESVSFLNCIKESLEDPYRMLIKI